MTSKERVKLKKQAMELESIFRIGKMGITPQTVDALRSALKARELIKVNILKNCDDEVPVLAKMLSERTGAEIVQVIGRRIVLYKKNPKKEEKKKISTKQSIVKKKQTKVQSREESTGERADRKRDDFKGKTVKYRKSRKQG